MQWHMPLMDKLYMPSSTKPMWKEIKERFSPKKDPALVEAETSFDELMAKVQSDETDLDTLERNLREEWKEINRDVNKIESVVNGIVDKNF